MNTLNKTIIINDDNLDPIIYLICRNITNTIDEYIPYLSELHNINYKELSLTQINKINIYIQDICVYTKKKEDNKHIRFQIVKKTKSSIFIQFYNNFNSHTIKIRISKL